MKGKQSFASELGARLRSIRLGTYLTQEELAERMGYSGRHRRMPVQRLETGGISDPSLYTVARYLQGCAARWNSIVDLLEAVPPVKPELKAMRQEWQSWGLDMKTVLAVQRRVFDLFPGLVVSLKGVRRSRR